MRYSSREATGSSVNLKFYMLCWVHFGPSRPYFDYKRGALKKDNVGNTDEPAFAGALRACHLSYQGKPPQAAPTQAVDR